MTPELTTLLDEWHSGRDKRDAESARFASRWYDSVTPFGPGRAYVPHVDDLVPDQALTDAGVTHLRARFAVGADGGLDMRIETEGKSGVVSERWRGGDLSVVNGAAGYMDGVARVAAMVAEDAEATSVADIAGKVSVLKWQRVHLMDCAEAGGVVDVDVVTSKISEARADLAVAVAADVAADVAVEERV